MSASSPYFPPRVQVLFVGESLPASGRHFYAADSGLFRAMRDAFEAALPPKLEAADFRVSFRDLGCRLIDLAEAPVDRLSPVARRAACRAGEARLSIEIGTFAPRALVTVVRSIEPNVRRAVARTQWAGEWLKLPYPGRWARPRAEFTDGLGAAVRRWIARGVLELQRA